jgi:hypothetical protein
MMFCVRTCFPAHGAFPCHHSCIKRCPAFVNTFNHSHEFSLFRLELNPATFTNRKVFIEQAPKMWQDFSRLNLRLASRQFIAKLINTNPSHLRHVTDCAPSHQGCQILLFATYQNGEKLPKDHKIYQMAKYRRNLCKIFKIPNKNSQGPPNMNFWWNIQSGNPASHQHIVLTERIATYGHTSNFLKLVGKNSDGPVEEKNDWL